jgi:Leucine rich repeat
MKGTTKGEWQAVLHNDVWSWFNDGLPSGIHQAFYLSYEDLPSPLKQCFILCSLYPEDHLFLQSNLIYLWFAEGFLQDNGNLWKLGVEYYKELLLRNLLEDSGNDYDQYECKMHDLLWSFARYLGKDENHTLKEGESMLKRESSLKLRRLSMKGIEANSKVVNQEKCLRTLLIEKVLENALADLCRNLFNLRILDLRFCNISTLPSALSRLVHLRYLDVSNSMIRILPVSMGNLKNLVYLNIRGCIELSHLPHSITSLRQLRYLSLQGTNVEMVPAGLKNLEKLIQLHGFKPGNNPKGSSSLDDLEALSQLVGLFLDGLERASEMNIVKIANLTSKHRLQKLRLEFTSLNWEDQVSQTNEKKMKSECILNELSPPHSLEILEIRGYFGNYLPNWLNLGATLPNLRFIEIINCNCFENLAPLGQLPNLDYLLIKDAYSVVSVGEELLGTDMKSGSLIGRNYSVIAPFPKLDTLRFEGMENWKEWQWKKGESAMPKLRKLFIRSCPLLRSLPEGISVHATSLEHLEIERAENLIIIENFPSIKDIRVSRNSNLERMSNLSSVSHIQIQDCPNLKTIDNLNNSVQLMKLYDSKMKVLPEYLRTIMPEKLKIGCSEELLRNITNQDNGGSEWNKFKHIPKVKINSWDESLYATYQKTPFSFITNINYLA